MSVLTLALLAILGLAGGIGITALGPGGVLPTVGLFALTTLSPAEVAGTSIVTHIATGALGTAAYTRSGQLRDPATRRTAVVLAGTAVVGTPMGVLINSAISSRVFGVALGVLLVLVVALVWLRDRHSGGAESAVHPTGAVVAGLGLMISTVSGVIGIGGPMLTVPLLVALGVPVLESLAAAQAQSVVIATVGTLGYLANGAINWPLAALIGIPELAGVVIGWKIAHALPTRTLKRALLITLLVIAPYLAFHG